MFRSRQMLFPAAAVLLAMTALTSCGLFKPTMNSEHVAQIETWSDQICPEGYTTEDISSQSLGGSTQKILTVSCSISLQSSDGTLQPYIEKTHRVFSSGKVLISERKDMLGDYPVAYYDILIDEVPYLVYLGFDPYTSEWKPYLIFTTTEGSQ